MEMLNETSTQKEAARLTLEDLIIFLISGRKSGFSLGNHI